MLNLFGKNVFARKRKAKVMPIDITSRIETLEERVVLASQVTALYDSVNGNLTINGSGFGDDFNVTVTGQNLVTLSVNAGTTLVGVGGPFLVTGNLTINGGNGNDVIHLRGGGGGTGIDSGNIVIDLGSGDDTLNDTGALGDLFVTGNVAVTGGSGNDIVRFGSAQGFSVANLSIDTTSGAAETVTVDRTTAGGNVTIVNSGTGLQQALFSTIGGANVISGNLTITQSNIANTGGYTATVSNTGVVGNVTVTNGSGTGAASASIISSAATVVGGTTTVTNGNNNSNLITLSGATLTLTKGIVVKNGNATTTNIINVDGVVNSGTTSATFTNGNAASNAITFGTNAANSFLGTVTATDGNATTSSNIITVNRTSFAKPTNLINGTAATSNVVTIGSLNFTNTVTGNLAITNGTAASANNVNIDRLTTNGAKVGDVTVNNAAVTAGSTNVILGVNGINDIGGNLIVRNQNATVLRTVTATNTDVSGTTGFYIYNVGAGNTDYNFGVAGGTDLVVDFLLKIEDGSGTADIELNNAILGSFTYTDLGGGSDALDIATVANASVTINGVTRIDTAGGSDDVTIATATGTAVFNDLVYIALGAGNDDLLIGAGAASPAFSTASDLSFDGGAGVDTVNVSALSIADYEVVGGALTKKLKQKIKNFETYTQS